MVTITPSSTQDQPLQNLINKLLNDFSFSITFDYLYTSLNLLYYLYENGIGGIDTLELTALSTVLQKAISKEKCNLVIRIAQYTVY